MGLVRGVVVLVAFLLAVGAVAASDFDEQQFVSYAGDQVLRFPNASAQARIRLRETVENFGLDLWAEHPEWVDIRVPSWFIGNIDALHIPYTVMIDDLESLIHQERLGLQVQKKKQTLLFS